MPIEADNLARYRALLEEKQQKVENLTDLKSAHASRTVAETILLLQALHLAGYEVTPEFIVTPNAARSRMMIRNGDAMMSSHTFFSLAITDDVYVSSQVIAEGKFVKGIYGLKNNKKLRKVTRIGELQKFTAVSSSGWAVDWKTMQKMGLRELRSVPRYPMMLKLVANNKVDFVILEFPDRDDLKVVFEDTEFYPVHGLKVGLLDSRHYTVSTQHPKGKSLFIALEQGLKMLRDRGTIEKFLRDVGFYNPRVDDWELINK